MTIDIKSRKAIERMALKPFPDNTALISIADYGSPFASLKNKPAFLLQTAFDDEPMADDFGEELGHEPTDEEKREIERKYHTLTEGKAREIADFYNSVKSSADLIICQCEHGQSRSAAIAAAFKEYSTHDGIAIFADDRYFPNKSIFRKILSLLRAETNI